MGRERGREVGERDGKCVRERGGGMERMTEMKREKVMHCVRLAQAGGWRLESN